MYKLVIADEEEDSLHYLTDIVKRRMREIEIAGVANSGMNALLLAEETDPDFLIICVQLSVLSGFEVIQRLRKQNKKPLVIVISLYDYFDFVKESIQLGAFDYLLKPINEELLVSCLGKALLEIKEKEKKALAGRNLQAQLAIMEKYAGYSFIFSEIFNESFQMEWKEYVKILNLEEKGFAITIKVDWKSSIQQASSKKSSSYLYNFLGKQMSQYGHCIIGPQIMQRIIIFMGVKQKDTTNLRPDYFKNLGKEIQVQLYSQLGLQVKIGIGAVRNTEDFHQSYEEALQCLRFAQENPVVFIEDLEKKNNPVDSQAYLELETAVLEGVRFGREDALEYFLDLLECLKGLNQEEFSNKVLEIIILACREARRKGNAEINHMDYLRYAEEMKEVPEKDRGAWARWRFEYILKSAISIGDGKKSSAINEALSYIGNHYREKLTLKQVADHVGITTQHFCKLFKMETGKNFVDYLAGLRMEDAKSYLKEGVKTISEIGYKVGYEDPNYFSRVFKKTVGKTPTAYIQEIKGSNVQMEASGAQVPQQ